MRPDGPRCRRRRLNLEPQTKKTARRRSRSNPENVGSKLRPLPFFGGAKQSVRLAPLQGRVGPRQRWGRERRPDSAGHLACGRAQAERHDGHCHYVYGAPPGWGRRRRRIRWWEKHPRHGRLDRWRSHAIDEETISLPKAKILSSCCTPDTA
jgi:hypothetical protein